MQTNYAPTTVRFTADDSAKVDRMVSSGFAVNRTDYIRRAVREQILRDAESLKA